MDKITTTGLLFFIAILAIQGCAQITHKSYYSINTIQGGWWSDCDDPTVEFLIDGHEYSGDFAGKYKLELSGSTLVFNDGLVDGHGINVTHTPLSFQILAATERQLVLRPLPGNPYMGDWHLQSCKGDAAQ